MTNRLLEQSKFAEKQMKLYSQIHELIKNDTDFNISMIHDSIIITKVYKEILKEDK